MKTCITCKENKPISNFARNCRNKDGHRNNCRQCMKAYNSQYFKIEENKKANLKRGSAYQTKRAKVDISFRLAGNLRSRLRSAIKNNQKNGSAIRDLGCSVESLKNHLESLFKPGMTWENYGEWHIDHIEAMATFDLTKREQILKACHFSNLQPIWKTEHKLKTAEDVKKIKSIKSNTYLNHFCPSQSY